MLGSSWGGSQLHCYQIHSRGVGETMNGVDMQSHLCRLTAELNGFRRFIVA
jgi:hypothetical protein